MRPAQKKTDPEPEGSRQSGEPEAPEATGNAADAGDAGDADVPAPDGEDPAPDGGPVFEAADRRARIVADHRGVRLTLDDQGCDFRWDEIGAVETETARFGKRYTVTVHTPDRRWYPIEIEAPSRSRFPEWDAALDKVLDTYFDDGESAAAQDGESSTAEDGDTGGQADE